MCWEMIFGTLCSSIFVVYFCNKNMGFDNGWWLWLLLFFWDKGARIGEVENAGVKSDLFSELAELVKVKL